MKYLDAEKGKALSQNRIHSIVRSVWFCSGAGGNIHCRKGIPCSTRANGSMYPRPARSRLRRSRTVSTLFWNRAKTIRATPE